MRRRMRRVRQLSDRVGLGWRREIAAQILTHLDEVEVVEVLADDYVEAPRREIDALRALGAARPLSLHGVSLGLASTAPVDGARLEAIARLVDGLRPESWSEHLAFVRGGGFEIGHLAAPPRTRETIAGAVRNLAGARRIVGSLPLVENVATLIDPPASDHDEAGWISAILRQSHAPLLLDLHNLFANATNFGPSPHELLGALPLDQVRAVHLAGGRWIGPRGGRRLLDDHRHAVPDAVFELLRELARRAPQPLTVILERDGDFPPFDELREEMARARRALAEGRARATDGVAAA